MTVPPPKRDPEESARRASVREFDGKVWDLVERPSRTRVSLRYGPCGDVVGLRTSASFRDPATGFWARSSIHGAQVLGAWAVL
jgi:hypothetical protein